MLYLSNVIMENQIDERVGNIESYIEGPRWAAIKTFLLKEAINNDLTVLYCNRETSLLRETVFFNVRGTESNLNNFRYIIKRSIDVYNE